MWQDNKLYDNDVNMIAISKIYSMLMFILYFMAKSLIDKQLEPVRLLMEELYLCCSVVSLICIICDALSGSVRI
jgi:hypothetical protein